MQARKFIPAQRMISASQEVGRFSIQGHKKLLLQKMVGVFFIVWQRVGGLC